MTKLKLALLLISLLVLRLTFNNSWSVKKSPAGDNVIRSKVFAIYQETLPRSRANLLSGIMVGNVGMDKNFKVKLVNVGLSHVVAASGMNVTFIFSLLVWLMSYWQVSKLLKTITALLIILLYASLTGFDPPIVRATIMAAFSSIGILLGRQASGWVGLMIAAYLMLWAAPNLLISPSFLLSFSSMAGQIFLSSIKIRVPIILEGMIQIFLQSLFAIIFTLPIVIIFFGNFSPISLITNVLVLWTVQPLMILGTLIASFGFFFTPFARAWALPAQGLLEYFLWVVNFFNQTNVGKVSFRFSSNIAAIIFAIGYYFVLSAVVLKLKHVGRTKKTDF